MAAGSGEPFEDTGAAFSTSPYSASAERRHCIVME
jgi:hypothetical protein